MADETDYVWDPDWSHPSFFNIPTSISSQAITTISINKDYFRITRFTIDATPLNYNTLLTDRTGINRLNSTIIKTQENLIGTKLNASNNATKHFPIHLTLTTPKNKNTAIPQTTIQSTVKPSVIPKYPQLDYQTFKPETTSRQTIKQKTSNRNNFSDHNYILFAKSNTTKSP